MQRQELTACQQAALDALGPVFAGERPGAECCLTGWAGTGKTFTLGKLGKIADGIPNANGMPRDTDSPWDGEAKGRWDAKPAVLFLAPTHKAARQIEKSMRAAGVGLDVRTIHSALAIRPVRNDGEEVFVQDTSADLLVGEDTRLIIIDELSMVSQELLGLLRNAARRGGAAIVGVGDPAQLAPVGQPKMCDLFEARTIRAELKEVVRHDGAILNLATETRGLAGGLPRFAASASGGSEIITYRKHGDWGRAAVDACIEAERLGDYDRARILCWTNRSADTANAYIHDQIYGPMADQFYDGQPVISHGPILSPPEFPGAGSGLPICQGSTEMMINECGKVLTEAWGDDEPCVAPFIPASGGWGAWEVMAEVIGEAGEEIEFSVIDRDCAKAWEQAINAIRKEALAEPKGSERRKELWKKYWYRRDMFAEVGSIWAMTIHKSQGSTFSRVFLHRDIAWNKNPWEQRRLAYVAITRASQQLHVTGGC